MRCCTFKASFTVLGKNKQRKLKKKPHLPLILRLFLCLTLSYLRIEIRIFTVKSSELDSFRNPLAYLIQRKTLLVRIFFLQFLTAQSSKR